MKNSPLLNRMRRKSRRVSTVYRVVAVAMDRKNDILGIAMNKPSFIQSLNRCHAERILMDRYSKHISKIVICRFGHSGAVLPIKPCRLCAERANELGIVIDTLKE